MLMGPGKTVSSTFSCLLISVLCLHSWKCRHWRIASLYITKYNLWRTLGWFSYEEISGHGRVDLGNVAPPYTFWPLLDAQVRKGGYLLLRLCSPFSAASSCQQFCPYNGLWHVGWKVGWVSLWLGCYFLLCLCYTVVQWRRHKCTSWAADCIREPGCSLDSSQTVVLILSGS